MDEGQLNLKKSRVLIIGAGGLGCPAAAYIAGAGVGTLGIVDDDEVEISNLHRQILHSTSKVGMKKVDSAISFLKTYIPPSPHQAQLLNSRRLNPNVQYVAHASHLSPQNAEEIVKSYDLVLDCTDTPSSRYLISDVCVLLRRPLISASALRTDGQLVVLNSPTLPAGDSAGGPCYRCVFPKPPPPESVVSCGDGGILGPVVGVMGVLQGVEAIRMSVQGKLTTSGLDGVGEGKSNAASMLLFSANSPQPFRSVKLRSRRAGCFACSKDSRLRLEGLKSGSLDYSLFCGLASSVDILRPEERIQAREYKNMKKRGLLIDVREKVQFDICSVEDSINVPFSTLQGNHLEEGDTGWLPEDYPQDGPIYVVCRLGNDSQVVARKLKDAGLDNGGKRYIGDIKGGLKAWKEQVDAEWPEY